MTILYYFILKNIISILIMRKLFSSTFHEVTYAQTSSQETSESRSSLGAVNQLQDICVSKPPGYLFSNVTLKMWDYKGSQKMALDCKEIEMSECKNSDLQYTVLKTHWNLTGPANTRTSSVTWGPQPGCLPLFLCKERRMNQVYSESLRVNIRWFCVPFQQRANYKAKCPKSTLKQFWVGGVL